MSNSSPDSSYHNGTATFLFVIAIILFIVTGVCIIAAIGYSDAKTYDNIEAAANSAACHISLIIAFSSFSFAIFLLGLSEGLCLLCSLHQDNKIIIAQNEELIELNTPVQPKQAQNNPPQQKPRQEQKKTLPPLPPRSHATHASNSVNSANSNSGNDTDDSLGWSPFG